MSDPKRSAQQQQVDATILLDDDPCWGSPTQCSLQHLLSLITKEQSILYSSPDYLVLNKPPDLRMSGAFRATVNKLLTFWYPPDSIQQQLCVNIGEDTTTKEERLHELVSTLCEFSDTPDYTLRPCHQLDYATSGVLLVARSAAADTIAKRAFEERRVKKSYAAVLQGHLSIAANWPRRTAAQLQEVHSQIEERYRRTRKRKHKDTFQGFMPAFAMFDQWQGQQKRQTAGSGGTASNNNKKTKKKKSSSSAPQLSEAEWTTSS